jgi:hypothetical protein
MDSSTGAAQPQEASIRATPKFGGIRIQIADRALSPKGGVLRVAWGWSGTPRTRKAKPKRAPRALKGRFTRLAATLFSIDRAERRMAAITIKPASQQIANHTSALHQRCNIPKPRVKRTRATLGTRRANEHERPEWAESEPPQRALPIPRPCARELDPPIKNFLFNGLFWWDLHGAASWTPPGIGPVVEETGGQWITHEVAEKAYRAFELHARQTTRNRGTKRFQEPL